MDFIIRIQKRKRKRKINLFDYEKIKGNGPGKMVKLCRKIQNT